MEPEIHPRGFPNLRKIYENRPPEARKSLPEGPRDAPGTQAGPRNSFLASLEPSKSLLEPPRGEKKIHGVPPGRSWPALGFIFQPPVPQGLPEALWEVILELLLGRPARTLLFAKIELPPTREHDF